MTPVAQPLPEGLILKSGSHAAASREMCVMEAVAFVAGEKWSDSPQCACPVVSAFLRSWNDAILDEAHRTALLWPLITRLIDTRSTKAVELKRSRLALDWLARVNTPVWLDLSESLKPHAAALRALAPLVTLKAVKDSSAALGAARAACAAACAAARDAACAAARDAAWDAAWDALRPSVVALEQSALVLVDRMLAVTPETTDDDLIALCQWPPTNHTQADGHRGE